VEETLMAQTSMEIVLSEDLKQRLDAAAKSQGKTVREFVQEALYTYVEDIEDGVMSDVALTEKGLIEAGNGKEAEIALDNTLLEGGRKTA
jgi:predicted DNA-binding protein